MKWLRVGVLAAVLALSAGAQAQARWLRAESANFIIYSDGRERALRGYAERLEIFDEALRLFHPTPKHAAEAEKLEIYLVADEKALDRIWRGSAGVAGFYRAGPSGTFAVSLRDGGEFAEIVLFHEYTHHFMARYFPYPYPAWLVEGWAEYFGSSKVYRDRIEVGRPHNHRAYGLGGWVYDTRELFHPKSKLTPRAWMYFYPRAWLLTHYMMAEDARREQLNAYIRMVGEGGDPIDSLEDALGYDIATLDENLRQYAGGRIPYTPLKRNGAAVPMTVTEMAPSADAVLLEKVRLLTGVSRKDAESALNYIQFRAGKHQGDRLADLTLARAHILLGDPADAEPILRPYVADPTDAEALMLMGLRYSRMAEKELGFDERQARREEEDEKAAEEMGNYDDRPAEPEPVYDDATRRRAAAWYEKARPWLTRANHADPESYEVLYAFAKTRWLDDDYPSEEIVRLLGAVHAKAPQVGPISMTYAKALMAVGRRDNAAHLLQLLANDPHGGRLAAEAKALLEQLGPSNAAAAGDKQVAGG